MAETVWWRTNDNRSQYCYQLNILKKSSQASPLAETVWWRTNDNHWQYCYQLKNFKNSLKHPHWLKQFGDEPMTIVGSIVTNLTFFKTCLSLTNLFLKKIKWCTKIIFRLLFWKIHIKNYLFKLCITWSIRSKNAGLTIHIHLLVFLPPAVVVCLLAVGHGGLLAVGGCGGGCGLCCRTVPGRPAAKVNEDRIWRKE